MKWIRWKGMIIPDKDCFKPGKKCTPECSSYDMGWLYPEDDDKGYQSVIDDDRRK